MINFLYCIIKNRIFKILIQNKMIKKWDFYIKNNKKKLKIYKFKNKYYF
jgi:hypothetical protein